MHMTVIFIYYCLFFPKLAAQNATALPLGHKHTEFSETAMENELIFLQF